MVAIFEQLDCTVEAFLIADGAIKKNVLVESITWEANWELFDFPLRLQSMCNLKCLSILTVTKTGDCDLWRRARLQIKKKHFSLRSLHCAIFMSTLQVSEVSFCSSILYLSQCSPFTLFLHSVSSKKNLDVFRSRAELNYAQIRGLCSHLCNSLL